METIQKIIRNAFKEYEEKILVETETKTYTYNDMRCYSEAIAGNIQKHSKEQKIVGLYFSEHYEYIAGLLGVLLSRNIFVPLDTELKDGLNRERVKKIDLDMIITDDEDAVKGAFPAFGGIIIDIKHLVGNVEFIEPEYSETDKIYVYFTSGSTGEPKAILGKNSALVHYINWEIETFKIKKGMKVLQWSNLTFDASLRDIFVPLVNGGCMVIPKDTNAIEETLVLLENTRTELLHTVPSRFKLLFEGQKRDSLRSLKHLFFSGEILYTKELKEWIEGLDNQVEVVNLYGSTETTMTSFYHIISEEDLKEDRVPIGQPMLGKECYLLDDRGKFCLDGATGEVYVVSEISPYGYLGDENEQMKKFVEIRTEKTNY